MGPPWSCPHYVRKVACYGCWDRLREEVDMLREALEVVDRTDKDVARIEEQTTKLREMKERMYQSEIAMLRALLDGKAEK